MTEELGDPRASQASQAPQTPRDGGRTLHVHLPWPMLRKARAGRLAVVERLRAALPGWSVEPQPATEEARAATLLREGWTLLPRQDPLTPRSLCLRVAYVEPFWRIDAGRDRARFDVALDPFPAGRVDQSDADAFVARWAPRAVPGLSPTREGFVLVPLQGRLLDHRSFQSMSPLSMLEASLSRDPRPHRATLHPGESYGADEIAALGALAARVPRLTVTTGGSDALLAACDHVVTQNSSVAFRGFFLRKRAVLFAGVDFHHVAGSVPRDGLDKAWASLDGPEPPFARYLLWFLRLRSINVAAADAPARLLARLRRLGMPA